MSLISGTLILFTLFLPFIGGVLMPWPAFVSLKRCAVLNTIAMTTGIANL